MNKTTIVLLMVICTLFTSLGQLFYKIASKKFELNIVALITNWPLITGLFFYFIGAVILIIVLKHANLSFAFPLIALSFVWVFLFGVFFFKEPVTLWKVLGTLIIIIGVIVLRESEK